MHIQNETVICLGEWDRELILRELDTDYALVLGEGSFPQSLTASQMGRFYAMVYPKFSTKVFRELLQSFHLSPDTKLSTPSQSHMVAVAIALAQGASVVCYETPQPTEEDRAKDWHSTTIQRLLRHSSTIQLCHSIEDYPYWEDSTQLHLFSSGQSVLSGRLSEVLADTATCTCTLTALQQISPKDYLKKVQSGTEFRLLLSHRKSFSQRHPRCQLQSPSLLDIISFF